MSSAIILVTIALVASRQSVAQQTEPQRWHVGPFVDFSIDLHTANFQHLPGVPNCCPQFTSGFGLGGAYGMTVDFPIDTALSLGVSVASASIGATLSHEEPTSLQVNGVLTDGAFLHTIDATLKMIAVEPMVAYSITNRWTAMAGISYAWMQNADYVQQEIISKPAGAATFVDANGNDTHSRIRGQSSGGLPGSSDSRVALFIGARYNLPLNKHGTLLLQPEAQLGIGVTDVVQNLSWLAHTLRLGATLVFAPRQYNDEMRTRDHFDTVKIPSPSIVVETFVAGAGREHTVISFEASTRVTTSIVERTDTIWTPPPPPPPPAPPRAPIVTVEACGTTTRDPHAEVKMIVEESYALTINPLLPYLFFEENSDVLPQRYTALTPVETSSFNSALINAADRLATYHHLLNIIGQRLRNNSFATISITGCGCDRGMERDNTALSMRRALAVQRYLHDTWGIESKRMTLHARLLPERAANPDTDDGQQEDRRVEIVCNEESTLAPLLTTDTMHSVEPPVVCFHTGGGSQNARGSYSLIIEQNGSVVKKFTGTGDVPQTLDWHVDREPQTMPREAQALHCTLQTTDTSGRVATSHYDLPIVQRIDTIQHTDHGGGNIKRFRLFLYEVRGSSLPAFNKPVLRYIADALRPGAVVRIAGFTDRLGNPEYNRTLSEQRARRAAAALHLEATATIQGNGISSLYDSALPEGRLYTRTVEVEVETATMQ